MLVRRARPDDGPAFLRLVCALAEFEHLPPPDEAARERLLEHAFADPPLYELWVGEIAPEPDQPAAVMAYAVTFTTYSTFLARPTLYLEDVFVHPDARRRGLGRAIMEHLRDLARARGCGRFEWTVLDWNENAKDLYHSLGAELLAEWQLMRITL